MHLPSHALHGIEDFQRSYQNLFCMKWINTVHAFDDNAISTGYGREYDSLLTKKFDANLTGFLKFAHFVSEGDVYVNNLLNAGLPDCPTRRGFRLD